MKFVAQTYSSSLEDQHEIELKVADDDSPTYFRNTRSPKSLSRTQSYIEQRILSLPPVDMETIGANTPTNLFEKQNSILMKKNHKNMEEGVTMNLESKDEQRKLRKKSKKLIVKKENIFDHLHQDTKKMKP